VNTILLYLGAVSGILMGIAGLCWMWKSDGAKAERLKSNEASTKEVKEASRIDNAVTRHGDGTVFDELRTDWTKK
jgi:hypothetical protein